MSETKAEIRSRVRAQLRSRAAAAGVAGSARLVANVMTLVEWRSARAVLLFVPLADEPAVFPLVAAALSAGKRVALPAFERETGTYQARVITNPETDLITGRFGVPEPRPGCLVVPVATLDFTVVPGVAFTPAGERLGRGLGFYDRMLANFRAVSCGVGFEEQIVAELPVEPHDVQLTYVATPAQVWACQSGSF